MATTTQFDSYFFGSGLVDDARKGVAQAVARTRAAGLPVEGYASSSAVSDQPSHLEQSRDISQDRVHVNHRGHHAQRFTDTERCNAANPPDLYPPVQGPIGCSLPAAWRIHCSAGPAPWDERQCIASLAQGACAQRLPSNNAARPRRRCPHKHANTRIPARTAATPATWASHAADAPCDQD